MDPSPYKITTEMYDTPFLSNMNMGFPPLGDMSKPIGTPNNDGRRPVVAAAEVSALDTSLPNGGPLMKRNFKSPVHSKQPKKPYASPPAKRLSTFSAMSGVSSDASPTAGGGRRKERKNNREKQRRSELNDKFDKLCQILNLGRKTKAEKFAILAEGINVILTLKAENAELKAEKAELRSELAKLTSCLQQAFPNQQLPIDTRFATNTDQSGLEVQAMMASAANNAVQPIQPMEQQQFEPASVMAAPVMGHSQPFSNSNEPQHAHVSGGPTPFAMGPQQPGNAMQEGFDLFA